VRSLAAAGSLGPVVGSLGPGVGMLGPAVGNLVVGGRLDPVVGTLEAVFSSVLAVQEDSQLTFIPV
jgi:hypothetical protein